MAAVFSADNMYCESYYRGTSNVSKKKSVFRGLTLLQFTCGYKGVNTTNHLQDELLLSLLFLVFPEQQQN